jgi:hypothetical protein
MCSHLDSPPQAAAVAWRRRCHGLLPSFFAPTPFVLPRRHPFSFRPLQPLVIPPFWSPSHTSVPSRRPPSPQTSFRLFPRPLLLFRPPRPFHPVIHPSLRPTYLARLTFHPLSLSRLPLSFLWLPTSSLRRPQPPYPLLQPFWPLISLSLLPRYCPATLSQPTSFPLNSNFASQFARSFRDERDCCARINYILPLLLPAAISALEAHIASLRIVFSKGRDVQAVIAWQQLVLFSQMGRVPHSSSDWFVDAIATAAVGSSSPALHMALAFSAIFFRSSSPPIAVPLLPLPFLSQPDQSPPAVPLPTRRPPSASAAAAILPSITRRNSAESSPFVLSLQHRLLLPSPHYRSFSLCKKK